MRAGLTILTLAGLLSLAAPAWADNSEAIKAFDEGRKLRDERRFEEARAAFEQSLRIEESIGANYNLGYCHEQLSHPYDALRAYRRAATIAQSRTDPRLADANSAIKKLLDSHDHVVLVTPPDVAQIGALEVAVDDTAVPRTLLNGEFFTARRQDVHTVSVRAPGHQEVRAKLRSGNTFTVVLGAADDARTEPGAAGPWGWQKWTGLGLVGAGVVTAGVGIIVALDYYAQQDALTQELARFCMKNQCLTPKPNETPTPDALVFFKRAQDLDSRAVTRNVIVFGTAGLLVAGGAILFLTAPSPRAGPNAATGRIRIVPHLGPRATGLDLVGTF